MPIAMSEISTTVENGIHYTPAHVAVELARGISEYLDFSSPLSILDPACGDGALLRASMDELGGLHSFYGCDLFPPNPSRWVGQMNFNQGDFFKTDYEDFFDAVVTNPPYIQFGRLDSRYRDELHKRFSKDIPLSGTADLWVYFLLKSISHLRKGGVIAAVIPWSFLEADFSHTVRKLFSAHFRNIRVLVLRDRHFSTTEKRVLLLWMSGYGQPAEKIDIGFSERVDDEHTFQPITRDEWANNGLITGVDIDSKLVIKRCRFNGWVELGSLAKIGIGVVTGANDFFIRSAGSHDFCSTPILTSVNDLQALEVSKTPPKELLFLDPKEPSDLSYIQQGFMQEIHKRSHCKRRGEKWYEVNAEVTPDAFFTYRVSSTPYLALNPNGYNCTNALHKVSFVIPMSANQRKWIALFLLSDISQLSLELNGRHYGNGVLKIEPSALKKALVELPSRRISVIRFNKISDLISAGRKEEAAAEATAYCREVSSLPKRVWNQAHVALQKIRARRK